MVTLYVGLHFRANFLELGQFTWVDSLEGDLCDGRDGWLLQGLDWFDGDLVGSPQGHPRRSGKCVRHHIVTAGDVADILRPVGNLDELALGYGVVFA